MIFRMWDLSFGTYMVWVFRTQTWKFFEIFWTWFSRREILSFWRPGSLHSGFPRPKTWEISGYGFQDVGSQLWVLDFHTGGLQDQNLKILGRDFQDVGSQFWDLNFTLTVSKTQTWEILGHDSQDMGSHFLGPEKFQKLGGSVTQHLEMFRTWFSRRGIPSLGPGFYIRGFQDPNLETLRTWFSRRGTSILGSGFSYWGWWLRWPRTWKFFRTWFSRRGIPSLGPEDPNLETLRTWFSGRGTSVLESGFRTGGGVFHDPGPGNF